ncbi:hypothetical protein P6F28_02130 [Roseicyclus marinus]|uniref:hypothetical protein n=2 Tax=Roseicyclus marinus TaxID=2161673 RepID=UPI0024E17D74|nr:hypothetical protein [Roseicyclus marinus]MDG3040063.1 hypothetical protein [Roseicyclus marinus]
MSSFMQNAMPPIFRFFVSDDSGAVTVDWTVLSAASVAMSLATVGVLNGGLQSVVSRVDAELREQQMSDNFVQFTSAHFQPLYQHNLATAEQAELAYDAANTMMNQEIIDSLQAGIQKMEAGQLTQDEVITLLGLASVARQRNILDPEMLDYYFGVDGGAGVINLHI